MIIYTELISSFLFLSLSFGSSFPKESSVVHEVLEINWITTFEILLSQSPGHCDRCSKHCSWLVCLECLEDLNFLCPRENQMKHVIKCLFVIVPFTFPFPALIKGHVKLRGPNKTYCKL